MPHSRWMPSSPPTTPRDDDENENANDNGAFNDAAAGNDGDEEEEDTTTLLEQTLSLFRASTDAATLKRNALALMQIKENLANARDVNAKALIRAATSWSDRAKPAASHSNTTLLENERAACSSLEAQISRLQVETAVAESDRSELDQAERQLQAEADRLEEEWKRLGGERAARQKEEMKRAKASVPVLRRSLSLWTNITGIKWNVDAADPHEMSGYVMDVGSSSSSSFPGYENDGDDDNGWESARQPRVTEFRFTGTNDFELANRVWGVIN